MDGEVEQYLVPSQKLAEAQVLLEVAGADLSKLRSRLDNAEKRVTKLRNLVETLRADSSRIMKQGDL